MRNKTLVNTMAKYIEQGHTAQETAEFFGVLLEQTGSLHKAETILAQLIKRLQYMSKVSVRYAGEFDQDDFAEGLDVSSDPELINGFVVEGENVKYDLTLSNKLEKMFK